MRIIHNIPRFPRDWRAASGLSGDSLTAASPADFRRHGGAGNLWLVNGDVALTYRLAALKAARLASAPLVVVDLVLRAPRPGSSRLSTLAKRALLCNVDHFIHYFRDLEGYQRVFGIGPDRSSFVPFKANFLDRYTIEPDPEGDYVLCLGRSMRDFDTFFDAIETLPYPAAITTPDRALFALHGARFSRPLDRLPANVRILDDDGSDESMIRFVRGARLVVVPVLRTSLVASGISTALNAMIIERCVIGSAGPGMSDIFTDEVLIAPTEDAAGLAAVIRRAWEDDSLRRRTAAAGRRYALEAGAEPQLYQRILDCVAAWSIKRTR